MKKHLVLQRAAADFFCTSSDIVCLTQPFTVSYILKCDRACVKPQCLRFLRTRKKHAPKLLTGSDGVKPEAKFPQRMKVSQQLDIP